MLSSCIAQPSSPESCNRALFCGGKTRDTDAALVLEALAAPTPGCYSRHGNWAPTHANWGHDDRSVCLRVKSRGCAPGEAYVEYRAPSASANTYLVLAGVAAAGADGVKRELVLQQARDDEAVLLPTSLPEALAALRADDVLVEALGEDFLEWYTLVKDAELADVAASTAKFSATGLDHDAAVQEAWNSLYFEFV